MVDGKILNYYVRKRCKSTKLNENQQENRLNLLPDVILTDIISRLPIKSAAATSVLSRRWRHLWTTVNRLKLIGVDTSVIDHVFRHLPPSPNLHNFDLDLEEIQVFPSSRDIESCFRVVCSRHVQNITVNAMYDFTFRIPSLLLKSPSLVSLKLCGSLKLKLPKKIEGFSLLLPFSFNLPNLKVLHLSHIAEIPNWLETLINCCPLLEDLVLGFEFLLLPPPSFIVNLNVIAPNLKSLSVYLHSTNKTPYIRVCIDAPRLANLVIYDNNSTYHFIQNPITLVKALINLGTDNGWDGEADYNISHCYLQEMSKFVVGLSSVSHLELILRSHKNIFAYLNNLNLNLPLFSNLVYLETNCFKDVLLSLKRFPNLEHLVVQIWLQAIDLSMERKSWCAPNSVPECLVSKLKIIKICALQGIGDDLIVLEYILNNANVLNKLCIDLRMKEERELAYVAWKEGQFARSLFKLPRSSSTCEVVVSGRSIEASSNALQNGYLTCQMYVGK